MVTGDEKDDHERERVGELFEPYCESGTWFSSSLKVIFARQEQDFRGDESQSSPTLEAPRMGWLSKDPERKSEVQR